MSDLGIMPLRAGQLNVEEKPEAAEGVESNYHGDGANQESYIGSNLITHDKRRVMTWFEA